MSEKIDIKPNPKQWEFLATSADICIFSGAMRGGKTYAALMECLRHVSNPKFKAVVFRNTYTQIYEAGSLYDSSCKLFQAAGAKFNRQRNEWKFPSGAVVKFSYLDETNYEQRWKGAEIPLIVFEELTDFSEEAFFFIITRNLSSCGIAPYVRATTNPDPMSWVKQYIDPWINKHNAEPAESGEIRWTQRKETGCYEWHKEAREKVRSLTVIKSSILDNADYVKNNPQVFANLENLTPAKKERFLHGNWETVDEGAMFRRSWFNTITDIELPPLERRVRFWDMAATETTGKNDPDYTAGVLMGKSKDSFTYVLDVKRIRATPQKVEQFIRNTAEKDGIDVPIFIEREGGSSGKVVEDYYTRQVLYGFNVRFIPSRVKKEERAAPLSAQAEKSNIVLVKAAAWNNDFLNELCAFPTPNVHDDQVDAASGAFAQLAQKRKLSADFVRL